MSPVVSDLIARNWQYAVIFLTLNNLVTDILSRKYLSWFAFLSGLVNVIGWIILLGTKAPFARSITLYAIVSYALTVAVAAMYFDEPFTRRQVIGIIFGGIAVALLA